MEPTKDKTSIEELILRSVDERIKLATDPMLKRVEELRALLMSWTEMEAAGNSEVSGSRRNRECSSASLNQYDTRVRKTWLP